jgi:hypothetical protein
MATDQEIADNVFSILAYVIAVSLFCAIFCGCVNCFQTYEICPKRENKDQPIY